MLKQVKLTAALVGAAGLGAGIMSYGVAAAGGTEKVGTSAHQGGVGEDINLTLEFDRPTGTINVAAVAATRTHLINTVQNTTIVRNINSSLSDSTVAGSGNSESGVDPAIAGVGAEGGGVLAGNVNGNGNGNAEQQQPEAEVAAPTGNVGETEDAAVLPPDTGTGTGTASSGPETTQVTGTECSDPAGASTAAAGPESTEVTGTETTTTEANPSGCTDAESAAEGSGPADSGGAAGGDQPEATADTSVAHGQTGAAQADSGSSATAAGTQGEVVAG